MADPQIEKLLIVQDRDITLQRIEKELAHIPIEKAKIERLIKDEAANIEAAGQALKEKEVRRNELENEIASKETAIGRFRTQQLEIKKNEEYKALTQQIEQGQTEISDLEEEEIALMLEIDEAKEAFAKDKQVIDARIENQKAQIVQIDERAKNLEAAIDDAKSDLAQARSAEIDENYLEQYDRVKKLVQRAPYVVPIKAHKCKGCHLRVSNEISRAAIDAGEPHFCDQCSRMVYA